MMWPILIALVILIVYTAAMNGVFKRCPHCAKIGSWRYDEIGPSLDEKDADDVVIRSTRQLRCRVCRGRVTETWSDLEGRAFVKTGHVTERGLNARGTETR